MRQQALKYRGSINIDKDTLFIFFDTETVEDSEGVLHISLLSFIAHHYNTKVEVERKTLVNKEYLSGDSDNNVILLDNEEKIKEWFTNYVIDMTTLFRNVIVVSHNLHFDRIAIDFKTIMDKFSLKYYSIERNMFLYFVRKYRSVNRALIFNDNMNYYPMSLKKVGKSFGIEKLLVDSYNTVSKQLIEYNIRDVEILAKSHLYVVEKVVKELGMEKYYLTASSIAFSILLNKYLPKDEKIYTHHIPEVEKLERGSYKGGRNENRVMGIVKKKVYKLDVNSQYPYIMLTKKFPLFLRSFYDFEENKKMITIVNKKDNIIDTLEVSMDIEDPMKLLKELLDSELLFIIDGIFDIKDDVIGIRALVDKTDVSIDDDIIMGNVEIVDPYSDSQQTSLIFPKGKNIHTIITSEELKAFADKIDG